MAKPEGLRSSKPSAQVLPLDPQHVEKLGLGAFVRLSDEAPGGSPRDPGIYFSLVLWNQEIKFKVGLPLPVTLTTNTHQRGLTRGLPLGWGHWASLRPSSYNCRTG